jgi:hypothetical protein
LAFKLGVRGDLKPFLKQQAFKEQQRRVGLAAFGALAGGIRAIEQLLIGFQSIVRFNCSSKAMERFLSTNFSTARSAKEKWSWGFL